MKIAKEKFGVANGQDVHLFTIENDNGYIMKVTNYGGIVTSFLAPDKQGNKDDVVLGFDKLDDYLKEHPYFGALVGRYANRIAKGQFAINNQTYELAVNNGPNHLHGGISGFDKKVWEAREINSNDMAGIKLFYLSKDMEEGYPGNLEVYVQIVLTNNNELSFKYEATTDKDTHINLTHHGYFNLNGCKKDILDHQVMINSGKLMVADENLTPTGEFKDVAGTAYDFSDFRSIRSQINDTENGYDFSYALGDNAGLKLAAKAFDPESGRMMETHTTEPAVHFYTANFLDGTLMGKNGKIYNKHDAICFETQHFPDTPNQPSFPSTLLKPGEVYHQTTVYKFLNK